jgi:hypothetical protein
MTPLPRGDAREGRAQKLDDSAATAREDAQKALARLREHFDFVQRRCAAMPGGRRR